MHRSNPALTERFELMVNGKVANAYSELNDPIDQEERFIEQMRLSEKGDDEAMFIDQDFPACLAIWHASHQRYRYRHRPSGHADDGQTTIQEVLFHNAS
ncbi:MAG: hypothetical protein ACLRS8_10885 [Parabacteroides merdae]